MGKYDIQLKRKTSRTDQSEEGHESVCLIEKGEAGLTPVMMM